LAGSRPEERRKARSLPQIPAPVLRLIRARENADERVDVEEKWGDRRSIASPERRTSDARFARRSRAPRARGRHGWFRSGSPHTVAGLKRPAWRAIYVPRSPTTSVLYGVVRTHLTPLVAAVDAETDGSVLPSS
jgi:hypothetical protein